MRLAVAHSAELGKRLAVGASVAVAGVCLTVIDLGRRRFAVELSRETLVRTRLGRLRAGEAVNLEPALRAADAMGGHWVQGHVDGLATLLRRDDLEAHAQFAVEVPRGQELYLVEKGSVTLDGVSLTVTGVDAQSFGVALVPHTLAATTLGEAVPGHRFHFEADILAKYVERRLAGVERAPAPVRR